MHKELTIILPLKYNETVVKTMRELARKYSRICYVTLNKTSKAMMQLLNENAIDCKKFYFVDLITPTTFKGTSPKNCIFLDSIKNHTSPLDPIIQLVKKGDMKVVVFDSLSSFLVYRTNEEVMIFFNSIFPFLEELNVDIDIFALDEDFKIPVVKQMKMCVDDVTWA